MADLQRFHTAQEGTFAQALAELTAGKKTGHWIWWVFPQLAGLGESATSARFAIADLAEARAYLADPVLGPRLKDAATALMAHADPAAVLGPLDATKARSSFTLFESAGGAPFAAKALERLYGGQRDDVTLALLGSQTAA